MDFPSLFAHATGGQVPYPYQQQLAETDWPETLVVPTGFGKTAGVLGGWIWKIAQRDAQTPRRLVYCLPMRTLVEQSAAVAQKWIEAAGDAFKDLTIELHVLMGGATPTDRRGPPSWIMNPERPTILIGTQDLLVSAALMRAYGASRYRWPVDFALLHNDALWVFDEVQLAGAALATSAQLEAFRRAFATAKPSRTLWMSATLDPSWLKTVDFRPKDEYRPHDLKDEDLARASHLWTARKRLSRTDISAGDVAKNEGLKAYAAAVAKAACERARPGTNTILFLNTVGRAQAVFAALSRMGDSREHLLIHSRFRAAERALLMSRLQTDPPARGRIVVATQALEAGVDVTSATMITEVAPWSSLVQRFGRCNRRGECGEAGANLCWIDLPDEVVRPYELDEIADARAKLAGLSVCGPADLATILPSAPHRGPVIRKRDLLDLFDTEPDLSGFDVDVAPYVRDANDTDVRLFWRAVDGDAPPNDAPAPSRDELCPAPIGGAKALVKRAAGRSWRWDSLAMEWRPIKDADIFPGLSLWIDSAVGGYDDSIGFEAPSRKRVEPATVVGDAPPAVDDDRDAYMSMVRVSLARHSIHVHDQAAVLATDLGVRAAERALITTVGLWHDCGKAHHAFVALTGGVLPPLAKWPKPKEGEPRPKGPRKNFRHELASALAFLAHRGWSEAASLYAYLIAAHHGKVRMRLRALPTEREADRGRLFARGVWDQDTLPPVSLGDLDVPETVLNLDIMQLGDSEQCGPSWSARAQRLLKEHGPFRLAWLEALVRIADWRASEAEERAGCDDL